MLYIVNWEIWSYDEFDVIDSVTQQEPTKVKISADKNPAEEVKSFLWKKEKENRKGNTNNFLVVVLTLSDSNGDTIEVNKPNMIADFNSVVAC